MDGPGDDELPMPEVTVIIAALNAAGTLDRQMAALAAQDAPFAFEVVVADNGSTDGTAALALAWQDRIEGLRVVDASAQRGAGFARNCGASTSHASVVAFCDADDEVSPGWLGALVPAALQHGMATGPVHRRELGGIARAQRDHLEVPFGFLPAAPTANLAVRRELFESLGGFTTAFSGAGGEDVELCWRAQLGGAVLVLEPRAEVRYHARPSRRGRLERIWHYEQCNARLYTMFRSQGMRREPLLQPLQRLSWVLRHPHLLIRDARVRDRSLRWLVVHSSRLVASIRLRVVFP